MNYPFEPPVAYRHTIFRKGQVDESGFKFFPPALRVGKYWIFLPKEKVEDFEPVFTTGSVQQLQLILKLITFMGHQFGGVPAVMNFIGMADALAIPVSIKVNRELN